MLVNKQGGLWRGGDEQGEKRRQPEHLQTVVVPVGLGVFYGLYISHWFASPELWRIICC